MDNENKEDQPNVQADNNSIAVGGISIGGDVSGNIQIGHTTGYTSEEVSVLITQITTTFQAKPFDGRCPYKGLDVFEEEDAELFFGREKLVGDLVERVEESRTVFVTGPSGSGKSSLVRAGLIHSLKQGTIKNSERWLYATVKPGRDPIGELGQVAASLAGSTNPEDEIRAKAMSDATIFARWCEIALKEGRDKRVVLFIDQFEEVFTQINNETERMAFLNLLTHAATVENGRVIILFSMRSDFVSNCATYPQLNALLNQQFVQIGAMQPEELVSAIAQPALRVGLRVDPDLIAQIINDMKGEPGALPLMQFALKDLFDASQAKGGLIALTLSDYLKHGGIKEALKRHADNVLEKLTEHEQKLARNIFSVLIEIGRGTQDTKRTALFEELVPADASTDAVGALVGKLADARLITTDEAAGKDTVTISHEKLIEAWPWLKRLVDENRDVIALQNEISADAKEWDEHKRDASYLYGGGRLINAREKLETQKLVLSGLAQEFIQAGHTKQRRGQLVFISGISTIIAILVLAVIIFSNQSNTNAELAEQNANIADTAQSASAFAVAQQGTAQANAEEAQLQANIAIARQLAIQAQAISTTDKLTANLIYLQSMKLYPNITAANYLINHEIGYQPISQLKPVESTYSFSSSYIPNSNYIISERDGHTSIWDGITGNEIYHSSNYPLRFNEKYVVLRNNEKDNEAIVWDIFAKKEVLYLFHDGLVSTVAISPDGMVVASGSWDGTIRLWDIQSGKEIMRLPVGADVDSLAFSPDGKYIASDDDLVHIWQVSTGKEVIHFNSDLSTNYISFSPDGKFLVATDYELPGNYVLWEIATGDEIKKGNWGTVIFSQNGRYIAWSLSDSITVWDTVLRKELSNMVHYMGEQAFIKMLINFSPDGNYIISGGCDIDNFEDFTCAQGSARVWNASSGTEISRMTHNDSVTAVEFSPDGNYVLSGSADGTVRVWNLTGEEKLTISHQSQIMSAAFSPNGKYILSVSEDGTTRVWASSQMSHDDSILDIDISNDSLFVASAGADGSVRVWESSTGNEIAHMAHDAGVTSVRFSPDGKYLVTGSQDGTARTWLVKTGEEVARVEHPGSYNASYTHDYRDNKIVVDFDPNNKYVLSGGADNTARVWDVLTGREISHFTHGGPITLVRFSPDGKYVLSGSRDGTAWIWDPLTGEEIAHMTHDDEVISANFSLDGKLVVTGSKDRTARVWITLTGNEIARWSGVPGTHFHPDYVTSISISKDGKFVVSGDTDGNAIVWELISGKEISTEPVRNGGSGTPTYVDLSPDSKYAISGSDYGEVHVWEVITGTEILTISHGAPISALAFSPDGKYIISGSFDGNIRASYYLPKDIITDKCSKTSRNFTFDEWKYYIGTILRYQTICDGVNFK